MQKGLNSLFTFEHSDGHAQLFNDPLSLKAVGLRVLLGLYIVCEQLNFCRTVHLCSPTGTFTVGLYVKPLIASSGSVVDPDKESNKDNIRRIFLSFSLKRLLCRFIKVIVKHMTRVENRALILVEVNIQVCSITNVPHWVTMYIEVVLM